MNLQSLDDHQLLTAAFTAANLGHHAQAVERFTVALKRDPGDPFIRMAMAKCYHAMGEADLAAAQLNRVRALAKKDPQLLLPLCEAYHEVRDNDTALAIAQAAERHAELRDTALIRQMELHERMNRLGEAEAVMKRAREDAKRVSPALSLAYARVLRRASKPQEARGLLESMIRRPVAGKQSLTVAARYLLADILHSMGEPEGVMEHLQKAKAPALSRPEAAQLRNIQEGMFQLLTPRAGSGPIDWGSATPRRSAPRLAFLVGHPRSGTTLLEQALDAHTSIASADESEVFANTVYKPWLPKLRGMGETDIEHKLASMDQKAAADAEVVYCDQMRQYLGERAGASVWLDKNPALIQGGILIDRLFPHAKLIVSLRDPRDVVLSAYMQHLDLNPWSVNWLTMEAAVSQYCKTMGVWLKLRDRIGMDWIEVRYEDTVDDLPGQALRATEFLGLQWEPAQADVQKHVRTKTVHSPTYGDVSKPIYRTSVGRWERYADYLRPFESQLSPFVQTFGYL